MPEVNQDILNKNNEFWNAYVKLTKKYKRALVNRLVPILKENGEYTLKIVTDISLIKDGKK